MGENKEEQQRKLRERLERKKKRLAQGSFSTLYYFKIISKEFNYHCHFKKIITVQTTHDRKPGLHVLDSLKGHFISAGNVNKI